MSENSCITETKELSQCRQKATSTVVNLQQESKIKNVKKIKMIGARYTSTKQKQKSEACTVYHKKVNTNDQPT